MNNTSKIIIAAGILVGISLAISSQKNQDSSGPITSHSAEAVATMPAIDNLPAKEEASKPAEAVATMPVIEAKEEASKESLVAPELDASTSVVANKPVVADKVVTDTVD